jgi:putative hydrolase of the HAD superfamily
MLKAILFDLDDTLIDWSTATLDWDERERSLMRGVYDYIHEEVHPLCDYNALLSVFREGMRSAWEEGRSTLRAPHLGQVMLDVLAEMGVPPAALDERRCLEAYNWSAAPGVVTFPDVPPLLDLLRANGIRVGIVTNAHQPMWLRDRELEQFGLLHYFPECRISAADVGYLKPHPQIFEYALNCMRIKPAEAVFVGDNPVADIAGAQGVGMRAVLRIRQPASPMLSGLIVPDRAVRSFAELPAVLDEWFPDWRA